MNLFGINFRLFSKSLICSGILLIQINAIAGSLEFDNTTDTTVSNSTMNPNDSTGEDLAAFLLANDPIFTDHWINDVLFVYEDVSYDEIPELLELPLLQPGQKFKLTWYGSLNSTYKWRWGRQHHGLDLGLHTGDSVMAAFDGVVRYAQFNKGGYGNCVIIRHLNGLETLYGHLSKLEVSPNQYVSGGQLIGLGGSTGHSMGPHLHFETRYKDFSFNPQIFIDVENQSLLKDTLVLSKSDFTANRYRSSSKKRQSDNVQKTDSGDSSTASSAISASSVVTDSDNVPTAEQNEISNKATDNIVTDNEENNTVSDNKRKEVVTYRHRSSYKKESKSYSRNYVRNSGKKNAGKSTKINAAGKTKHGRHTKDVTVKKKDKNERNSSKNKPSYTIKKGDNLSSISKKTGIPVNKLRKSNNIKSDKKLKPGHKIRLHK